jgi:glutathione S-transferase
MTTLVVCLDGTGQIKVQVNPWPTNISRMFDTIGGVSVDAGNGSFETTVAGPPAFTAKYIPGVGTQGDPVLKLLGNAFGDGIAEPIVRGYTFLSRNYAPGDDIILTGFSRGATAARALAGLIVNQGLLDSSRYAPTDKTAAYLRAIGAWYAYRQPKGNLVGQIGLGIISGTLGQPVPTLTAADFTPPPPIRAVGVFDTVSSLGLPLPTFGAAGIGTTFDFSILDTSLHPDIAAGFHALAADETRDLFSPTFWAARAGVVQQIFPGCHSDVGGGFPHHGLSDAALDWMLNQLGSVGLVYDTGRLGGADGDRGFAPSPLDIAQNDGATPPFVFTPRSARAFPAGAAVPSQSLLDRTKGPPTEMIPSITPTPYKPIGTYADGQPLC